MRLSVDKWLRGAIDLLVPAHCQYCHAPSGELAICGACRDQLPWNRMACPRCALPQNHDQACRRCLARPPAFDAAWSAFRLETPVQQGIHQLKYRARFLEARLLGQLMAEQLRQRPPETMPQWLIPVPLHRRRLWTRGYNQALELGRALADGLPGLTLQATIAHRTRATADQIGMSAVQRRRNVRDAFAVDADLGGRSVALIDDVMTTGATLDALAHACRRAGAVRVEAWCVARVA